MGVRRNEGLKFRWPASIQCTHGATGGECAIVALERLVRERNKMLAAEGKEFLVSHSQPLSQPGGSSSVFCHRSAYRNYPLTWERWKKENPKVPCGGSVKIIRVARQETSR